MRDRLAKVESRQGNRHEQSYEDVCVIAWKGYKASKGAGEKGPNGSGTWHRGKGADVMTSGRRDDGGKKVGKMGSKGSKPDGYGDKDKGGNGSKRKGRCKGRSIGKGKGETRYCYDCGEEGHIGMICPHKWTNNTDEEEDQGSSRESEPEGEKAVEPASLETPDDDGGCECVGERNGYVASALSPLSYMLRECCHACRTCRAFVVTLVVHVARALSRSAHMLRVRCRATEHIPSRQK